MKYHRASLGSHSPSTAAIEGGRWGRVEFLVGTVGKRGHSTNGTAVGNFRLGGHLRFLERRA